ncbi:hypothetical protein CBC_0884 [Clostridium botulinum C str. Eklund]|nr:hypothetical protein CBC_0884 [Clostridium botulinum C str. Eklund]
MSLTVFMYNVSVENCSSAGVFILLPSVDLTLSFINKVYFVLGLYLFRGHTVTCLLLLQITSIEILLLFSSCNIMLLLFIVFLSTSLLNLTTHCLSSTTLDFCPISLYVLAKTLLGVHKVINIIPQNINSIFLMCFKISPHYVYYVNSYILFYHKK